MRLIARLGERGAAATPLLPTRHETDRGVRPLGYRRRASAARSAAECRSPRIVALGGGTGLPNVLRGLRPLLYGDRRAARDLAPRDRLVAIVATSDDGGSSGKLRAAFNIIPPGDIRNCLAALSDNHALIADIFQYRFGSGDGLNGHALGNLVLTALADVMNDFPRAVEIAARVVGAHGTVLPATSEIVTLMAEFEDGRVLSGETAIAAAGSRIARVSLIPERPRFLPETCDVDRAAPTSSSPARQPVHQHPAAAARPAGRRGHPPVGAPPGARRQPDDGAGRDRRLQHPRAPADDRAPRRRAVVRLCHLQHRAGAGTPRCDVRRQAFAAHRNRHIRVERARETSACEPIGVPLVSEHPRGSIRHHPERLAAAIAALGQRKSARGAAERKLEASDMYERFYQLRDVRSR